MHSEQVHVLLACEGRAIVRDVQPTDIDVRRLHTGFSSVLLYMTHTR